MQRRSTRLVQTIALAVAAAAAILPAQTSDPEGEWPVYARTNASTRYSSLDQINKDTVANLRIAWRQSATPADVRQGRPDPPPLPNYQNTPVMVGGRLYISTGYGTVAALDAATGKVIWFDPGIHVRQAGARNGHARRRVLDGWP